MADRHVVVVENQRTGSGSVTGSMASGTDAGNLDKQYSNLNFITPLLGCPRDCKIAEQHRAKYW